MFSNKFSQAHLNKPYLWFLLKQYSPLAYIPMVVFITITFLCHFETMIPFLLLGLYSFSIVPIMALMLNRTYTSKGETSYLLSIPLTRKEQYFTTYLTGLILILIPIIFMSVVISFMEFEVNLVWMMIFDAFVYYSIAMLACMIQGTLFSQIFSMGVLALGPIVLYAIVSSIVSSLSFRGEGLSNNFIYQLICPLTSGFTLLDSIQYWGWWPLFHFACGCLCIYLGYKVFCKRPNEKSGSVLFERFNHYFMEPFIFLVIFNIMIVFSLELFDSHYFNDAFYFKLYAFLIAMGLLIAFFLSIWTSKELKELASIRNFLHCLFYSMLGFILIFVPLSLSDGHKKLTTISKCEVYGSPYSNIITDQNEIEFYNWVVSNRSYFKNRGNVHLFFQNPQGDSEMFFTDYQAEFPEAFNQYLVDMIKYTRENYFGEDFYEVDGSVYSSKDLKDAIRPLNKEKLTPAYFTLDIESYINAPFDIFSAYANSLSDLPFDQWLNEVLSNIDAIIDQKTVSQLKEMAKQKAIESLKEINFDVDDVALDYTEFTEVKDDFVQLRLETYGYANDVIYDDSHQVLTDEDMYYNLQIDVSFRKENNQFNVTEIKIVGGDNNEKCISI